MTINSINKIVHQIHFIGWPDHGVPKTQDGKIFDIFNEIIKKTDEYKLDGPIVVHCSAGIGRTGAFCTIQTHMDRMHHLKAAGAPREWVDAFMVDTLWTAIQLRWCRFGMIQQIEQYNFCYSVILDEARALGLIPLKEGDPKQD